MFRRGWNYMFGGGGDDEDPKKPSSSSHQKSIDASQSKIKEADARVRELERKAAKERKAAQAYGSMAAQAKTAAQRETLKKKGMAALKRAKMYDNHATKASGITANFENMTLETESIVHTKDMVDGMKDMHGTMSALKTEIDPDAVHDMMGEISDTMDEFADVMTVLSNPMDGTTMMDPVDMEDEFDAMMADEEDRLQEEDDVAALRAMEMTDATPTESPFRPQPTAKSPEEEEFEKMTTQITK